MQEKSCSEDNFLSRLRHVIKTSGLKQKDLAKKIGVSEISISRYCSGTQVPTRVTVNMLAALLGVSVSWLYTGEGSPSINATTTNTTDSKLQENDNPSGGDGELYWKRRAMAAEERLMRLETILRELFAFAHIGQ